MLGQTVSKMEKFIDTMPTIIQTHLTEKTRGGGKGKQPQQKLKNLPAKIQRRSMQQLLP